MGNFNDTTHKIADLIRTIHGSPTPPKFTSAIILAAGSSTRMGSDCTKQFIEINGMPVVAMTICEFNNSPCIDEIIVVAKKDEVALYDDFVEKYSIDKPFMVVEGGSTRQISARIGSDNINEKSKFVCIHDAARCLITKELIEKVCRGAYLSGAATLAIRATDTVKISNKTIFIDSTPERKTTWQAQTPQVFKSSTYRAAAYVARDEKFEATDDNMLLEHIQIPVKLIEGSRENIKITEKVDLLFANAVIENRKNLDKKNTDC